MIVALLGAESTGKTTLAQQLAQRLQARGLRSAVVAEVLREFCERAGRTPRPDEQAGIADEQWRRIEVARREADVVVADTTPLMIAVYSDYVFGDTALYDAALARQRQCTHTLLTGLDLPWQPDGLQRDGPQVRGPVDALIRGALQRAALPFAVIYGEGEARTEAALAALHPLITAPAADDGVAERAPRLRSRCRECLVPDCEHLSRLLPTAGSTAAP
ncbi:ATP-binding protein [uncultured Methylibium sp.]|uniref:ATP-binding protein n=1 Tax=uncultured Methylibium sp. TaxID=381093 RepID=UPI0025D8F23D|nr:ATP-binding protein [uncultured Methylibium sp.]